MATTKVQLQSLTEAKLTVDELRDGVTYNMAIANVTDIAGNSIAPGVNPKTFVAVGDQPQITALSKADNSNLDVTFDEPMDADLLEVEASYTLTGSPTRTISTVTAQPDGVTARVTVNTPITYGDYTYTVSAINLTDVGGNLLDPAHDEVTDTIHIAPFGDHATLETGLVAYYKMDGNGNDSFENSLNGTFSPNVPGTAPTQKIGTALDFILNNVGAPANMYMLLPNSPAILDALTNVAVSVWIYITAYPAAGSQYVIAGRRGQFYMGILGDAVLDGALWIVVERASGRSSYASAVKVALNTWTHLVAMYDGSTIKGYVNTSYASLSFTGPMILVDATNQWRVGAVRNVIAIDGNTNTYSYCKGYIDELGIWNRVLTTSEIADLYDSGSGLAFQ